MKKLFIILLTLLTSGLYAQDGIQFSHGTWKETLAKAKAENKLVFVDVYTSWCGPCKQMVNNIFPLKAVGDKFNASFINYKVDAEKGEGIDVASTYKVNAYPTYLFVNGDGVLYYTTMGAMPEADFIREANNALTEFKDSKPLPVWDAEYASKKNDKDFLMKYVQKRQKLRLKSDFVVDQYVSVSSREELLSKETLNFLLQQESASIDGASFKFVAENKDEIEKILGRPAGSLNGILSRYAASDLARAISKKDSKLMERIVAIRLAAPSQNPGWEADAIRMSFYTQTGNEQELIKVLDNYSKDVLNYDRTKIKESDAQQLKRFEEALASGQMKLSPAEIELSRKFYGSSESTNYAYRLRGIAEAALRAVNDKRVLNDALNLWLKVAAEHSDNFTIAEATAGILQKLGRKQEAIQYQQKAIESFAALKMDNEVITGRLKGNLEKIKENKPTWVVSNVGSVVTK